MTQKKKIESQFRSLLQATGGKDTTFYDESDSCVHTFEDGTLEVSTDFADYTSYLLSDSSEGLEIRMENEDGEVSMSEEDYQDLSERLERIVEQTQAKESLKDLDLLQVWKDLMTALFTSPSLGEKPNKTPALKKDSGLLAQEVLKVLQKSKRSCEWEWKSWSDIGVGLVNGLGPLQKLEIEVPMPAKTEVQKVHSSDDFTIAVLNWFDQALSPQGFTLIAMSPLDELQNFSLVCTSSLKELQALLKQMGISYQLASRYK